ncbi:YggT family protein [soil metagenome]
MVVVATVIYIAISLFIVVMWVRLVFDLVASFSRTWRPRGPWLVIAEVAYVITDPPVKAVRRVVPPLRLGGVSLDFAWSIVLLAAIIVSSIALGFMN